jgi:hypothetical protein
MQRVTELLEAVVFDTVLEGFDGAAGGVLGIVWFPGRFAMFCKGAADAMFCA